MNFEIECTCGCYCVCACLYECVYVYWCERACSYVRSCGWFDTCVFVRVYVFLWCYFEIVKGHVWDIWVVWMCVWTCHLLNTKNLLLLYFSIHPFAGQPWYPKSYEYWDTKHKNIKFFKGFNLNTTKHSDASVVE